MSRVITGGTLATIYGDVVSTIEKEGFGCAPRGQLTVELLGATTEVERPQEERFLFMHGRNINYAFGLLEGFQIAAGVSDLGQLAFFNPRMKRFADNGILHGAYGPRLRETFEVHEIDGRPPHWELRGAVGLEQIGDSFGIDQLQSVVLKLRADPDTRQAVASIWDPRRDAVHKAGDYPCNVMLMFCIRDEKLVLTVIRRSSDVVWGWPYDHLHFSMIQAIIAKTLEVKCGPLVEFSNSLHYYDGTYYKPELAAAMEYDVYSTDATGTSTVTLDQFDKFWPVFDAMERRLRVRPGGDAFGLDDAMKTIKKVLPAGETWLYGAAYVVLGWSVFTRPYPNDDNDAKAAIQVASRCPAAWKNVMLQSLLKYIDDPTQHHGAYAAALKETLKP